MTTVTIKSFSASFKEGDIVKAHDGREMFVIKDKVNEGYETLTVKFLSKVKLFRVFQILFYKAKQLL